MSKKVYVPTEEELLLDLIERQEQLLEDIKYFEKDYTLY